MKVLDGFSSKGNCANVTEPTVRACLFLANSDGSSHGRFQKEDTDLSLPTGNIHTYLWEHGKYNIGTITLSRVGVRDRIRTRD